MYKCKICLYTFYVSLDGCTNMTLYLDRYLFFVLQRVWEMITSQVERELVARWADADDWLRKLRYLLLSPQLPTNVVLAKACIYIISQLDAILAEINKTVATVTCITKTSLLLWALVIKDVIWCLYSIRRFSHTPQRINLWMEWIHN